MVGFCERGEEEIVRGLGVGLVVSRQKEGVGYIAPQGRGGGPASSLLLPSSDLNARSFSSVSARLDHFAERLNQQDQVISDNSVRIHSLASSVDQFQLLSESQFLSLKDQLKY